MDNTNATPTDQVAGALTSGMATAHFAALHPDVPAVISPFGWRTFGELNARANQLVRRLRAAGMREGDSIAVVCKNRPAFVETYAAALRAGFRFTPVNWHL